mgnify:FL=1
MTTTEQRRGLITTPTAWAEPEEHCCVDFDKALSVDISWEDDKGDYFTVNGGTLVSFCPFCGLDISVEKRLDKE